MTKRRIHGEDKEMMDWIRNHPELPSYSMNHGRTVNDIDFLIHQYMTSVDSQGSREIQIMMHIETKSRNGIPEKSQIDTFFKEHKMKHGRKMIDGKQVRHHGVSVLSMSGTSPENSAVIRWGRFSKSESPNLIFRKISNETLIDLLTFRIDPDTLDEIEYRRHHKTQTIEKSERQPLGFSVQVQETIRS
jgi:hypothetical protein